MDIDSEITSTIKEHIRDRGVAVLQAAYRTSHGVPGSVFLGLGFAENYDEPNILYTGSSDPQDAESFFEALVELLDMGISLCEILDIVRTDESTRLKSADVPRHAALQVFPEVKAYFSDRIKGRNDCVWIGAIDEAYPFAEFIDQKRAASQQAALDLGYALH